MRPTRLAILLLLGVLALNGCTESTTPPTPNDEPSQGGREFEGTIDPAEGSFVLRSIEAPVPDAAPVRVDLIGSNLRVDPNTGIVALQVAIRNADTRPLYPRIEVIASHFVPGSVGMLESDSTNCPPDSERPVPEGECFYAFDYSRTLGGDGVLEPGETSAPRRWVFLVPGLEPFSFSATARVGLAPDRPRIAGVFFWDENENGQHDPDEPGAGGGGVIVRGPDQRETNVPVGPEGRYSVPIDQTGLYTLTAYPPPTFGLVPVKFTTPNPLEVVITPDASGKPQSFLHADFGIANDLHPECPPVRIVSEPTGSIPFDFYNLIEIQLEDPFLQLHVGFSGCSADHPFQLLMIEPAIRTTAPPQVRLKLAHDDRGELCDAAWERRLCYDLNPIRDYFANSGGSLGTILLNFEDWNGNIHQFALSLPDSTTGG